jgi:hypothetical protein
MYVGHQTIQLPHAIARLALGRHAGGDEVCVARVEWTHREGQHNVFDFAVAGAHGDVILHARGYRTIEVTPRSR